LSYSVLSTSITIPQIFEYTRTFGKNLLLYASF